ncbi:MAG: helicase-related protein, partial [Candidatus Acidiferrum sp.]
AVMESFRKNETQILVATTVIEVGVDVPNATAMVIEHAERFGLAQLHQLRGRIGRGPAKSHCILVAPARMTVSRSAAATEAGRSGVAAVASRSAATKDAVRAVPATEVARAATAQVDVARARLETMVRTANGFEIAETDLLLRGPGEFFGTRQSGDLGFHIANPIRDKDLLEVARREAFALAEDAQQSPALQHLLRQLPPEWQRRYHLARIG